jgi:DNA polymerase elongation subunit (family B)
MELSKEEIKDFLEGRDPQKYIIGIESTYDQNFVNLIINDPITGKRIEKHKFKPFLWMKSPDMDKFFKGDRRLIKTKLREHMITITPLKLEDENGNIHKRLENGFKFLVQTRGSYRNITNFFKESGIDIQKEENRKGFLTLGPTEQFLIQSGKRLFKGFDDYADLVRFSFDIETTSLTPETGRILQIGMKDNRGFEHVLDIDSDDEERNAIYTFFNIIDELKPDIICGYNSENFDWTYILGRCELLNLDYKKITKTLKNGMPLYRKQATLKLGGEMEYYQQTVLWGYNVIDVWHAVRRAKAINSNIKETGLKYITKYSKIAKPNRVYVGHDKIAKIWVDERPYLFNESDGKYMVVPEDKTGYEGWEEVDGKFIIKKYLIDDLWETEQVDYKYNQATFLLSKLVPSTLQRTSTMGTAALWKVLMCTWSYENGLAIPDYQPKEKFPGGLSRLLRIGFVPNVVKLDYGSLYPSIQLTHDVFPEVDITGALKGMLTYLFAERDLYKNLMKKAQREGDDKGADMFDKKQLPIKILNNSNFGSLSAPDVFPWGDTNIGAMITCTGRQYLRLMIKFFMDKGFEPIVGDSVTYDTPVYIKYGDDILDILPISDLFDITGTIEGDQLRDYSDKPYKILTRSGWKDIKYVYRHGTEKQIKSISIKDRGNVDVTEDHSLFQNGVEIKPSSLKIGEYIDVYENGDVSQGLITNISDIDNPCPNNFVYDVSTEDGTFIIGKGKIIAHNTDGFNFKIPENAKELTYTGLGTHLTVVKDKIYNGIEAALAEFNEKYMRGFMKLGIDEVIESTINLSRKNYADLIDGEVKLVGNTIKSAKMPKYIEDFLDKAIRMLLEGNGNEFIELYYENVEMIYNQEIPLLKIASKGKVKQTLESYKENTKRKNKAGNPMPRQAHMELLLKENINVNLGDTIYYINTGTKKSHADVKAKKNKDGTTDIEFNSSLILTNQIENNPDLKGEYNVTKYLVAFNTRIEPLIVCFSPEIRSDILIDNPSKRQYFTKKQLELCSGFPTDPIDQDTLDDVFVMEQKEIDFWEKVGANPEYMYITEIEPTEIINEPTDTEYF